MKAKELINLIPTNVRITRNVTYEILWTNEFLGDHKQLGECRSDTKQILIKKGQSNTEAFKTFIHEVCHCFSFENKDLKLTEKQVLALENSIYRVLKLNNILDKLNGEITE